ncbi:hemolysin family protein [Pseudorhodoplanes sinuspersici]|uniref:Hemolysin n=1 Tax=Pseudorhodoplanes sinuspersici TaxID=1235591 RepID=A0A1W6ZP75_9HYPH|nr:hemolysin family protein [Pseudorhodoplanes sinuspersici]ARP99065.1 hemolysin [Pseudorhodoplanes sinuspersici]RKE69288.1 putative hemolysin [Pseudorhodoplanes sinuspersici]
MTVWLELAIVVGLILLNGFFAMAELAIVSSRRIRLQQMADGGSAGAARALTLAENPGRFLSGVQVGITLIGILSGAYGGSTLGARLGQVLNEYPIFAPRGDEIAFIVVVIAITALSVVVGELVPKRIALLKPEPIASAVAGPLQILVLIARPLVWFLETSTALLLKLLRIPEKRSDGVTEEEVRIAIAEGTEAGVIDEVEEEMIHGVLALADSSVASVMVPRPDVYWIDLADDKEVIEREIADCPYSRIVVAREGDIGRPLGVLQKKDLVGDLVAGRGIQVEERLIEPVFVPETMPVLRLLETFKSTPVHIAFVVDEYGDFLGVATLNDVLEGIAGDLGEEHEQPSEDIVRRPDGSWLVDGRAPVSELLEKLKLPEVDGEFHTAAGFALERLAHIPVECETFEIPGWRIEILDMDGKRIDKLLFVPMPQTVDG